MNRLSHEPKDILFGKNPFCFKAMTSKDAEFSGVFCFVSRFCHYFGISTLRYHLQGMFAHNDLSLNYEKCRHRVVQKTAKSSVRCKVPLEFQ